MKRAWILLVILVLAGCGGYEGAEQDTAQGMQVTKIVPYSDGVRLDLPPLGDREVERR